MSTSKQTLSLELCGGQPFLRNARTFYSFSLFNVVGDRRVQREPRNLPRRFLAHTRYKCFDVAGFTGRKEAKGISLCREATRALGETLRSVGYVQVAMPRLQGKAFETFRHHPGGTICGHFFEYN